MAERVQSGWVLITFIERFFFTGNDGKPSPPGDCHSFTACNSSLTSERAAVVPILAVMGALLIGVVAEIEETSSSVAPLGDRMAVANLHQGVIIESSPGVRLFQEGPRVVQKCLNLLLRIRPCPDRIAYWLHRFPGGEISSLKRDETLLAVK